MLHVVSQSSKCTRLRQLCCTRFVSSQHYSTIHRESAEQSKLGSGFNYANPFQNNSSPTKEDEIRLQTYKPRTPGLRHLRRPINDHLWKGKPVRKLTFPKKGHGKGGRNNLGRVTVRHRGGGHKRRIRTVDFSRRKPGRHLVERIEYDPNRSAHLALLLNLETKENTYIIAAEGMRAGDNVESFMSGLPEALLESLGGVEDPGMLAAKTAFRGNCLPLHMIPLGTQIYNVGSRPRKPAVFCRSAGTFATVVAKDETPSGRLKDVIVRLQSGEVRKVDQNACATIGVASNSQWHYHQLGKAGRSRWLNVRPTVRGVAMNAGKSAQAADSSPKLKLMQLIILTVVVGANPKETDILSALGVLRYVSFPVLLIILLT